MAYPHNVYNFAASTVAGALAQEYSALGGPIPVRPYSGEFLSGSTIAQFAPEVRANPIVLAQIWRMEAQPGGSDDKRTPKDRVQLRFYVAASNYRHRYEGASLALAIACTVRDALNGKRTTLNDTDTSDNTFSVTDIIEELTTESVVVYTVHVIIETQHSLAEYVTVPDPNYASNLLNAYNELS
jgi:hypothetical protein